MHLLLIGFALLLSGPDVTLGEDPAVVPMDHRTKHVSVMVHVNGHGPYAFIVDTYHSGEASLDDDLVRALGLVRSGSVLNHDGRTTTTRDTVTLEELRLGDTVFGGVTASVMDLDWIGQGKARVHGILGFASFRDLQLTIDYPGNRLGLSRSRLTAADPHTIPFSVAESGAPDIDVTLGDRDIVVGIDTGHRESMLLDREVADDLPLRGEPVLAGRARTVNRTYDVERAVLDGSFDLAGHTVESVDLQLIAGWDHNLIGYGLLRPFVVSFDQRSGLMQLVPPPEPTPPSAAPDGADRPPAP